MHYIHQELEELEISIRSQPIYNLSVNRVGI